MTKPNVCTMTRSLGMTWNKARFMCLGGSILFAAFAYAPGALAQSKPTQEQTQEPPFYINLDASGVLFNASGKINIGGQRLPGGSIDAEDNPDLTINLGYFVTPQLSVDLLIGLPPHAALSGSGTASGLGTAAYTSYGPAVLSLLYHFDGLGNFHPYMGPGVNYTLFMHTKGINLQNVKIADHIGAAFTVGFNDNISERWAFNVAVTKILLSTQVKASLGSSPVEVKATANPTVVQAGITYRF